MYSGASKIPIDRDELEFAGALAEVIPYKAASSTFLSIPIRHYSGLSCYIVGSSGDMLIEDYYAKLEWYNDIYK